MEHVVVIGAGVAGMAAARLLSARYRVTLLEREARSGGHVNTVPVRAPRSKVEHQIDTGFIVFNTRNYPHFTAMLGHLGVATQPSEMSFSVSMNAGAFEYAGTNLATLFCQPANMLKPGFLGLLRDIGRFNRLAKALTDPQAAGEPRPAAGALGVFLDRHGFGAAFRERYLLPMAAAIWSCPTAQMLAFPVLSLAHFFRNHGLLDLSGRPEWRTVIGGSKVYAQALLAPLADRLHLASEVVRVERGVGGVRVTDASGHQLDCDQVVFACHADQALAMLAAPTEAERQLLGTFAYQSNRAVLHCDPGLMPRRRLAWSAWNYLADTTAVPNGDAVPRVSVTYWMNCLQRLPGKRPYLVSLNPLRAPALEHSIASFDYTHPVFTVAAMDAQARLHTLQGQQRSWFCGAYHGYGFHEDGLRSAVQVAAELGVPSPWQVPSAHAVPARGIPIAPAFGTPSQPEAGRA